MRQKRPLLKPFLIIITSVVLATAILGAVVSIPTWVNAQTSVKKPVLKSSAKDTVYRTVFVRDTLHDSYSFTANVAMWNRVSTILDSAATHIDTRYSAEYVGALQTALMQLKDTLFKQIRPQYIADSAYWKNVQQRH